MLVEVESFRTDEEEVQRVGGIFLIKWIYKRYKQY